MGLRYLGARRASLLDNDNSDKDEQDDGEIGNLFSPLTNMLREIPFCRERYTYRW